MCMSATGSVDGSVDVRKGGDWGTVDRDKPRATELSSPFVYFSARGARVHRGKDEPTVVGDKA